MDQPFQVVIDPGKGLVLGELRLQRDGVGPSALLDEAAGRLEDATVDRNVEVRTAQLLDVFERPVVMEQRAEQRLLRLQVSRRGLVASRRLVGGRGTGWWDRMRVVGHPAQIGA